MMGKVQRNFKGSKILSWVLKALETEKFIQNFVLIELEYYRNPDVKKAYVLFKDKVPEDTFELPKY